MSGRAAVPAGYGGHATPPRVAEWEKACRNMVLSGVRNHAVQSVRVQKGALRMKFGVRLLRDLCWVGAVLVGIVFGTAVGAVATATHAVAQASSIVVEGNRRVEADTVRSYF